MISTKPYRCQNKDAEGRRCRLGAGHEVDCCPEPYYPNETEWAIMVDASSVAGVRRFVCAGSKQLTAIKGLCARGFLGMRRVSLRERDVWRTPAGVELMADRWR
jgi:hypothetical protein